MTRKASILLESCDRTRTRASYTFSSLRDEISASSPAEVVPALERIEAAVASGLHAAGYISYEAASGLDPDLTTHQPGPLPLLWFGIFGKRVALPRHGNASNPAAGETQEWGSSLSPGEYAMAIARIREYIAAGDTYQVNFTLRQHFRFDSPEALYQRLCRAQQTPFCAFLDMGRFKIASASPELFFQLRNGLIAVRPMKGTGPRGRWWEEDQAAARKLREDPKERAENLMIVDLLRNDLGKIAETGSVQVNSLFDLETLPTLHQMTSTITAIIREEVTLAELFRAIFPCGSVTGAPKKRAMEIIKELEESPRGIYTGCIGFISPGTTSGQGQPAFPEKSSEPTDETATEGKRRRIGTDESRLPPLKSYEATFSVAIRTILLDSETGVGELGVGSGITWDSLAAREFNECLAKGRFAQENRPEFTLFETMLFEEETGYFLLERHLERLGRSAAYFRFGFRQEDIRRTLALRSAPLRGRQRVKLILSNSGRFAIQTWPLAAEATVSVHPTAFARRHVDSGDSFLYHKTSLRGLYQEELANRPDCADIIFLNERGEVTEGANNNIVIRLADRLATPPLQCGLLPGVFREELLEKGELVEREITPNDLLGSKEIYLINSLWKWRRAELIT